ncbi:ankyrin, partial [Amniculicola lignicola CBS 123094]
MPLGRRLEIQPLSAKKLSKIRSWFIPLSNNARLKEKWKLIRKRLRLLDFPDELLLCIADYLETERDVNALSQVNRRLCSLLDTYLYCHNVQCSNSSALVWAAEKGEVSTARKLLEQRANVEIMSGRISCYPHTYTDVKPLWLAAWWGHIEMVKLLLEVPNIELEPRDPQQGKTPLHMAARKGYEEIVSLFINKPGIDLDRRTIKGKTALLFAAKHGHVEIVRRLLAKGGVDINTRASGLTPLLGAIYCGHEQVVEALLQNENISLNLQ